MKKSYEAIVGSLVWAALVLQFWLLIDRSIANGLTGWVGVARYFGYFTILTNILVALVLTIPLLMPGSGLGRFLAHPGVKTAAAGYIIVVGVVYSLILRQLWNPAGLQLIVDRTLHDFSPIAYTTDWLLFVPKASLRVEDLPLWLVYPGIYAAVALVRGAIFGWHPYPFLNASNLGYVQVLLNVGLLLAGFLVLGLILIKLGQRLKFARAHRI